MSFTVATSIAWSNKVSKIDRTQPLTITWSGGPETGQVLIGGWSRGPDSAAAFACVEEASKGLFTIPAHVFAALPASYPGSAYMFIGQHLLANRLSIQGLEGAYIVNAGSDYAEVSFR